MNFLRTWILIKSLVILFSLSGLFVVIRFFLHHDLSNLALVISSAAFFSGANSLFFVPKEERMTSKKYKHLGLNFWDPWQDIEGY